MCTPPHPHPLPMIAAPGQPARAGARVRTHGPRCQPRSPFLAAGAATAPRAGLAPPGDPPPPEHGGPERPRSLLSAAGGRVATFVNCKQTHVVLQQSRPCLVLVAFPPPRASSSPLPRRLPSSPSFFAVSGWPPPWGLGGPGPRVGPWRGRLQCSHAAALGARGGGSGSRVVCLQGAGLRRGRGACSSGGARMGGTREAGAAGRGRRGPGHVGGRSLACRPRPGAVY